MKRQKEKHNVKVIGRDLIVTHKSNSIEVLRVPLDHNNGFSLSWMESHKQEWMMFEIKYPNTARQIYRTLKALWHGVDVVIPKAKVECGVGYRDANGAVQMGLFNPEDYSVVKKVN